MALGSRMPSLVTSVGGPPLERVCWAGAVVELGGRPYCPPCSGMDLCSSPTAVLGRTCTRLTPRLEFGMDRTHLSLANGGPVWKTGGSFLWAFVLRGPGDRVAVTVYAPRFLPKVKNI